MGYQTQALYRIGETSDYVVLPDVYGSISSQTGLTKVEPGAGRNPIPIGIALARGLVRKFRARVQVSADQVRSRTLICANDLADSIRSVVGKQLPTNGTVPGGVILSTSLPRRRIWS